MNEPSTAPVIELHDADIATMPDPMCIMVRDVNWSVADGEFWVVAGAERSGKSDFLRAVAGLMPPAKGSCKLFGLETRTFGEAQLAQRLRVGVVLQGGPLFNSLTIAENVALPLRYQKNLSVAETQPAVDKLLELLELQPFADALPVNVPLVWRYRTALARALIQKPEVLLLDNPLAGLVTKYRLWLVHFLDQLWRGHEWLDGRALTVVAATDDLRPWQNPQRQFALLSDEKFARLGNWQAVETAEHLLVKEMLAPPAELTA
jgi:ABC-type transporter Mla maintaining outer membrane lipid asymmetry ATPase subunit MlaF